MELLCLQLKAAACLIYNTYLSESAPYSVNIDDTAKTEEKDLEQPTPDMFNKAQAQVCLESTLPVQLRKSSDALLVPWLTVCVTVTACVSDI